MVPSSSQESLVPAVARVDSISRAEWLKKLATAEHHARQFSMDPLSFGMLSSSVTVSMAPSLAASVAPSIAPSRAASPAPSEPGSPVVTSDT